MFRQKAGARVAFADVIYWADRTPRVIPLRGAAYITTVAASILLACAPLLEEAHAEQQVPPWVKQVFAYYVDDQITEVELLAALTYLIDNGIMQVAAPAPGADRGIADEGDFYAAYGPNPNSPYEGRETAAAWLEDTRLLKDNAEWLNSVYRLPYDVEIRGAECNRENAFWSKSKRTITVCYELVDAAWNAGLAKYDGDPDAENDFAYNVIDGILLHEAGHALIDAYDLPVTGMEEDAVDQFSALIQSRTYGDYDPYYEAGRDMMLDTAEWWDYVAQYKPTQYWSIHSMSEQRFYNIACYAYGADPEGNKDLLRLDYLPRERAKTCQHEYEQMSRSWDRLLDGYLVE